MSNEARRVIELVEGAGLCGLALSLLAFHFIIPGSYVVFIWLLPLLFAVAASRLSNRVWLMTGITTVMAASALFGLGTGVWACFYAAYGVFIGRLFTHRLLLPIQVIVSTVVCITLLLLLMTVIGLLSGVSWDSALSFLGDLLTIILRPLGGSPLTGWEMLFVVLVLIGLINALTLTVSLRHITTLLEPTP